MQLGPINKSSPVPSTAPSESLYSTTQDGHGIPPPHPSVFDGLSPSRSRDPSPGSSAAATSLSARRVGTDELDETSRRLSVRETHITKPGSRISAYENAATPASQYNIAFKVIKQSGPPSDGPSLTDCPNEILTQILSHLHPDSHGAVALVSKRFYSLMTEPHAWRLAFLRYFPGPDASVTAQCKSLAGNKDERVVIRARSEIRYFTRLTFLATWRSEYLLRTRLLRYVARGKPGARAGIGASARSSATKKSSAVLTYNSKLPWMISNVHAIFDNTKKGPRAIVGTADLCVSTLSDPSIGKVEKTGLDDPFAFAQLDEMCPDLEPYGLGEGPAAVYNVMDVSQPYGMIGGEGFPGGRPYYRAINEVRGRYLGELGSSIIDMTPEVPKIPELNDAICSVWIAKSSAVPTVTENMVGMMTGSSLGVVTAYALGHDASGPRYQGGEMTARWVLSPGVPIISIKIDESYNYKREALERIWACAVNALGEVFVLSRRPTPPDEALRKELDSNKLAWLTARTVYWDLIESTRRQARPDELDRNAVRGAYSPRSPCNDMALCKEQIIAEAREIEKYLRYDPAHFRKVCEGWDMRRKVEVDFAEETILVCRCLQDEDTSTEIIRHMRVIICESNEASPATTKHTDTPAPVASHFGSSNRSSMPVNYESRASTIEAGEWRTSTLSSKKLGNADITSTAIDNSLFASLASFEDPLHDEIQLPKGGVTTPVLRPKTSEIPGRRARYFGVGTDHGQVLLWNVRDKSQDDMEPICSIQTQSPDITSLALSALYVVCGGNDGLVQVWDPLSSTVEPIRTLNSKSSGRAPRSLLNANPILRLADHSTCSAIFLDPDATSLRGILCFGTFIRYWTYSSAAQSVGRKRRLRHSDVHGRFASRRQGHTVKGYIAAEEAELRSEKEHNIREDARLRNRFGVGMADLTEDESIRYAQMISEEAFLADEQRRTSASHTGSTTDLGETISTSESLDTVTSDSSLLGRSPSACISSPFGNLLLAENDDFEQQIQRALRLSVSDGQTLQANSFPDYEFQVTYKPQKSKRSSPVSGMLSQTNTPLTQSEMARSQSWRSAGSPNLGQSADEDLVLALHLSLQEEQRQKTGDIGLGIGDDGFPPLESIGKGKGMAR